MTTPLLTTAIKPTICLNTVLLSIILILVLQLPSYSSSIINNRPASHNNRELTLEAVLGNWVNMENGLWNYGFYTTFAIIDGAFWDYENVISKKGKLQIQLRHGEKRMTIYAQPEKGLLKVSTGEKRMTSYTRQAPANPDFKNYDNAGFKSPIIQRDSFRLSGLIAGYDPKKDDFKYVQVVYNPIAEDNQRNFVAELDSLGRFSVTFPLLNPQEIMLTIGKSMAGLFASPGSNVMVHVNKAYFDKVKSLEDFIVFLKTKPDLLFMGNEGILNTEINEYWPRRFSILNPVESQKLTDSLDQLPYKKYRLEKMNEQIADLHKYYLSHHSGKKFMQYLSAWIRYSAADDLLRYRWLRAVDLNQEYLSFLDTISLTNEMDASTTSYSAFIHEYLSMQKTQKEKAMSNQSQGIRFEEILEKAIGSSKEIKPEDKPILQRFANLQKHLDQAGTQQALKKDSVVFQTVLSRYDRVLKETVQTIFLARRDESASGLQTHLIDSLPVGVGKDILLTNMATDYLEKQNTLTPDQLSVYKTAIQSPVLYDEIALLNKALTNKLEGNTPLNTELLSPVAKSANNVLESLLSKYKGSVVYVDFWAPWCGPCMGEMPPAETLKKELSEKNVTFLYLCVNCSEESWTKTIKVKEIEGQHYRLSDNEYMLLSNLFKISGIPRYLLINKEGVVVDEDATRPSDKEALIKKIEDLLH